MKKHPLYNIHNSMMNRCYNEDNVRYKDYGGRGILVCKEWHDVCNFIKWMELKGWKLGLTLDRKDNNSSYSPKNCRLKTYKVQANNTRRNLIYYYKGKMRTLAEILPNPILYNRVRRRINLGWDFNSAISTPSRRAK